MMSEEDGGDPLLESKEKAEKTEEFQSAADGSELSDAAGKTVTVVGSIEGTGPMQYEHMLQWLELSISETERRTSGSTVKMQDVYVVYLIEIRITDPSISNPDDSLTSVWRRYSEFETLHNYLEVMYPAIVIPPLPEKRVTHAWQKLSTDRFDPDFVERRRAGLENFLLRVASHAILCKDRIFYAFLRDEGGWRDLVNSTDFQSKADSKLRLLSAPYRLKKTDKRFEELKNYSNELQTHVNNIVKLRAKIADTTFGIHRIHANYSRVFNEWSVVDKDMTDGLQSAAHIMDIYSTSFDSLLEDEEQFADQLKEYYGFANALRTVCRKQELMQLDLEKLEDALSSRIAQKEQLTQGKQNAFSLSGMKNKLFGGDTPEQREQRLQQLSDQIKELQEQVQQADKDLQAMVDLALRDIERFQRQKVKDVKDILVNYAIIQTEKCKKGIALWQSMKDCFAKM